MISGAVNGSAVFGLTDLHLLPGTEARVTLQTQIDQTMIELFSRGRADDDDCPMWGSVQNLYRMARAELAAVDGGRADELAAIQHFPRDVAEAAVDLYEGAKNTAAKVLDWSGGVIFALAVGLVALVVLTRTKAG